MNGSNNVVVISLILAWFVLGFLIGFIGTDDFWEKKAIEKGYAQHNPITAEFEWKENDCKFKGDKE